MLAIVICTVLVLGIAATVTVLAYDYSQTHDENKGTSRSFKISNLAEDTNGGPILSERCLEAIARVGMDEDEAVLETKDLRREKEKAMRIADRMVTKMGADLRLLKAQHEAHQCSPKAAKRILEHILEEERGKRLGKFAYLTLPLRERFKIKKVNQQYALAASYLGAMEWLEGHKRSAISAYETAMLLNRKSHEAWQILGAIYSDIGSTEQAMRCYKKSERMARRQQALKRLKISEANLNFIHHRRDAVMQKVTAYKMSKEEKRKVGRATDLPLRLPLLKCFLLPEIQQE